MKQIKSQDFSCDAIEIEYNFCSSESLRTSPRKRQLAEKYIREADNVGSCINVTKNEILILEKINFINIGNFERIILTIGLI